MRACMRGTGKCEYGLLLWVLCDVITLIKEQETCACGLHHEIKSWIRSPRNRPSYCRREAYSYQCECLHGEQFRKISCRICVPHWSCWGKDEDCLSTAYPPLLCLTETPHGHSGNYVLHSCREWGTWNMANTSLPVYFEAVRLTMQRHRKVAHPWEWNEIWSTDSWQHHQPWGGLATKTVWWGLLSVLDGCIIHQNDEPQCYQIFCQMKESNPEVVKAMRAIIKEAGIPKKVCWNEFEWVWDDKAACLFILDLLAVWVQTAVF